MTAWTSLSGYLVYKSGGTLGRLKSKKRLWFALDESQCQLLYYKSQDEEARHKSPSGHIDLKGAAITLDLDNENQFIIIVEGKEHQLTADNHESMMIWLLALQARRDLFAKKDTEDVPDVELLGQRKRSASDVTVVRSEHRPLCATRSLQPAGGLPDPAELSPAAQMRRQQLHKLGDSIDSNLQNQHKKALHTKVDRSRSLPPLVEGLSLVEQLENYIPIPEPEVKPKPKLRRIKSSTFRNPIHKQFSLSTENGFCHFPVPRHKLSALDGESSSGSAADSDELIGYEGDRVRGQRLNDSLGNECRTRGGSMSSDSAIEGGATPEAGTRVSELEKELIMTKCELAKVMNRQTCYQEILKQKDEIIEDLDDRLGKMGGDQAYDSKKRGPTITLKETQEKIRVLQNQNRFLNEEVRRLAKLRSQEQGKFQDQDVRVQMLEGEIEKWKLDYVSLIQSSIRFTGADTMDDAELSLYGGDRHKKRVQNLLEGARKINPSLPTYERLAEGEVHVDCYGFKHQFTDTGLLLHYLCSELTQHFLVQAGSYEEHQNHWQRYIRAHTKNIMENRAELKSLCRGGIPDQYRKQVWRQLVHFQVRELMQEKGPHYFRNLCNVLPDSPLASRYRKQVALDLMRTMPSNVKFASQGSKGIMDLQDILLAFTVHCPTIGYCQGMNFIVGMALLFMDATDAFWTLVAVTEKYFPSHYFDNNLIGAQADQLVLHALLSEKLPALYKHLEAIDIEISTVTLNWFLAVFFDCVPFQTLLRIWDCFLLEGPKVLFRFCLAILKLHEKEILKKTDTISVMRHLKACAKITYDVDGLVKVAFEDLKPFPRRRDILSKQTCYVNALKEKYKRKELQRITYVEREQLFMELEADSNAYLAYECCAVHKNGELWLCYGEQNLSRVCRVNYQQGVMTDLSIEIDSKVMAALALDTDAILFGTLSWMVYSFSTKTKKELWRCRVHDAVLSLCQYKDEETTCRVFAGLADGTIAVLENVDVEAPGFDVMYIPVGQSPVTCMALVNAHLWCASGNAIHLVNARTLDNVDSFTVSTNPYDHILTVEVGEVGVWVSVRGSAILELWDPEALVCKMLFDTRAGRYPSLKKEDEMYFNRARITSVLAHDSTVWIGTGEGNLVIYDVVDNNVRTPSSEQMSFTGSLAENLRLTQSPEIDPIRQVEEKVRELYYRRLEEAGGDSNNTTLGSTDSLQLPGKGESSGQDGVSNSSTLVQTDTSMCQETGPLSHSTPAASEGESTPGPLSPNFPGPSSEDMSADGNSSRFPLLHSDSQDLSCSPPAAEASTGSAEDGVQQEESQSADSTLRSQDAVVEAAGDEDKEAEAGGKCDEDASVSEAKGPSAAAAAAATDDGESGRQEVEAESPQEGSATRSAPVVSESSSSVDPAPEDKASAENREEEKDSSQVDEKDEGTKEEAQIANSCDDNARRSQNSSPTTTVGESACHKDEAETTGTDALEESTGSVNSGVPPPSQETAASDSAPAETKDTKSEQQAELRTPAQEQAEESTGAETKVGQETGANEEAATAEQRKERQRLQVVVRENSRDSLGAESGVHCNGDLTDSCPSTPTPETLRSPGLSDGDRRLSPDSVSSERAKPQAEQRSEHITTSKSEGSLASAKNLGPKPALAPTHSAPLNGNQANGTAAQHEAAAEEEEVPPLRKNRSRSISGSSSGSGVLPVKRFFKFHRQHRRTSLSSESSSHRFGTDSDEEEDSGRVAPLALTSALHAVPLTPSEKLRRDFSGDSANRKSDDSGFPPESERSLSLTSSTNQDVEALRRGSDFDQAQLENMVPKDPEATYRLEFTGIHVESDAGSTYSGISQARKASFDSLDSSVSSRPQSLVPEEVTEEKGIEADCPPASFIFPENYSLFGSGSKMQRVADYLRERSLTPTPPSTVAAWSSYDEISTPSRAGYDSSDSRSRPPRPYRRVNSLLSEASSASLATTEVLYNTDLALQAKVKISDKPVKCIVRAWLNKEPIIITLSGSYGDDEAVLKWKREANEMMWTNEPVLEICPQTNTTKMPTYMRARLSSTPSLSDNRRASQEWGLNKSWAHSTR